MADVTLVLKASNQDYINKMKEAQNASQKVYDTVERGTKREKGLIEDIEQELARLQEARKKAFKVEDIEKYNKKIQEGKKDLKEYEEAGQRVEDQSESLIKSFGKWIVGLGLVHTILNKLKEAFKNVQQGMILFNQAGAAMNQVLYNIVSGVGQWNKGVGEAIVLARQLALLNIQNNVDMIKAKDLMIEYNKLYSEGIDATISAEEKIKKLTLAKQKYIDATNIEIESTKKEVALLWSAWENAPESLKAQDAFVAAYAKYKDLLAELDAGTRRLTRQITAEQQQEIEKDLKARADLWDRYMKEIDETNATADKKEEQRIEKNKKLNDFYYDWMFDKIKEQGEKEKEASDAQLEALAQYLEDKRKIIEENIQLEFDLLNEKDEQERESQEVYASDFLAFADDLVNKDAKYTSDRKALMDKRVALKKIEVNKELALAKFGVANNLAMKQAELVQIQGLQQQATFMQLTAIAAVQSANAASFAFQKALAIADVIIKTQRANALARAISPLTLGQPWVTLNNIAMAKSIATILATSIAGFIIGQAAKFAGFAKGGWTGKGNQRDSTGERIAGVVHEKEFVIRKGPAMKFRDVLEAINRDDKKMIFNSFNKISPELLGGTTVNNVVVNNDGSNKRLDAVIAEQKKLNAKLTNDSRQDLGDVVVVKKGNTIRTIRR